jgi:hypothetical protein
METALHVIKSLIRTGVLVAGEGVGRAAGRDSLEMSAVSQNILPMIFYQSFHRWSYAGGSAEEINHSHPIGMVKVSSNSGGC